MALSALILHGYGISAEKESKFSIEKSGGRAEIVHISKVLEQPEVLDGHNMLMLPGGFSFGDSLGAGRILANKLKASLRDKLEEFVKEEKLILGIGNGFQTLVKMGLLPEPDFIQRASFAPNMSGHFENQWVIIKANQRSLCIFTRGIDYLLCPVRHGQGRFVPKDGVLEELKKSDQIVFQYSDKNGKLADYPHNPDGSVENIAGVCDKTGHIFGMMPHPEAFNIPQNCPYWIKGTVKEALGLRIFRNAVEYFKG